MKSYSDINQSRELWCFLPEDLLETADMTWSTMTLNGESKSQALDVPYCKIIENECPEFIERIPCWSLSALISLYPMTIESIVCEDGSKLYSCMSKKDGVLCQNFRNPVDACYETVKIIFNEVK